MSGTPKLKFPKSAHLLKHADFKSVYEKGKRHFSANLTVFYLCRDSSATDAMGPQFTAPPRGAVRIGFTVGRVLGGAVVRNRIRRRTREVVRQHFSMLHGGVSVDVVIHPKKSVMTLDHGILTEEIVRAFTVIRQRTQGERNSKAAQEGTRSA
ncbi:MAG TPA: ribonuclease P protein component [Clostridia bacterium]|nr:ribonuclease P protein component [Clostridia bacterium]